MRNFAAETAQTRRKTCVFQFLKRIYDAKLPQRAAERHGPVLP
jgi:hypothetical protein